MVYQAISSGYINIVMMLLQVEFFYSFVVFEEHEHVDCFCFRRGLAFGSQVVKLMVR
jgi:hypothetical protein